MTTKSTKDYSQGKIYKIEPTVEHDEGDIYIGSTTQRLLSQRMSKHKNEYKNWKEGKRKYMITSIKLFEKYGFENCKIILLENINASNYDELASKEAYYIKMFGCVNKCIPLRTTKEYLQDNKEKFQVLNKLYRETNKDKIQAYRKEYYETNKEDILKKHTEYVQNHREVHNKANAKYRQTHKENIKLYNDSRKDEQREYSKTYREDNKELLQEKNKNYREENKKEILERKKQYYEANKEEILKRQKEQRQKKKQEKESLGNV